MLRDLPMLCVSCVLHIALPGWGLDKTLFVLPTCNSNFNSELAQARKLDWAGVLADTGKQVKVDL